MNPYTESTVESAARVWLPEFGWRIAEGPDIASGDRAAEAGVKDAEKFLNRRGEPCFALNL
ncbi:hypothetical protein [Candidatus Roseilinea sp. NK_OTU-006]|jgi:hypothetical protein|uniref:hypothetical protein n=1 Tax=Candidatus Roseilinea sp. NK_OTU-006 TaxID=2704250 RepID=UPI00145E7AC0|nr:hypothetical protein [Candidatus Roseilinea sp. NK_OTU-006]